MEAKNKDQISKLIADAEAYLKAHYNSEYYQYVVASCKEEKAAALAKYQAAVAQLEKDHQATVAKLTDQQEIKDEKYVYKNRLFDAKMQRDKDLQAFVYCLSPDRLLQVTALLPLLRFSSLHPAGKGNQERRFP